VEGLGEFIEIEAGNILWPDATEEDLRNQCNFYMRELGIKEEDLLEVSYSDLMG
jgi:adenylate cyclase class IV